MKLKLQDEPPFAGKEVFVLASVILEMFCIFLSFSGFVLAAERVEDN